MSLRSMTGFGGATTRQDGFVLTSEIKTVNNRFFKTVFKISDGFSSLEPKIDQFLREFIDRGSINLTLRIRQESARNRYQVNQPLLDFFLTEAKKASSLSGGEIPTGSIADFLRLPGVIEDAVADASAFETLWNAVEANLREALSALNEMRVREGESMERNLHAYRVELSGMIDEIAELAPEVVARYREKLTERIASTLADHQIDLQPADLIREIALFTDKADISEEIVRFRSHLDQFDAAMKMTVPSGKRLDFLTQEMFREINTIGSKANFAEITNRVVDMKATVERIREMVQNVE